MSSMIIVSLPAESECAIDYQLVVRINRVIQLYPELVCLRPNRMVLADVRSATHESTMPRKLALNG